MSDPTRFPLCWPAGRPRTNVRWSSKFKVQSFARVRDELLHELKLLGAKDVILSSNLKLRLDGLPLANQGQPVDTGAAVYFGYKGRPVAFACDRWSKIEDNLQAIRHTIEALRGIARWGTGDMVEAAFSGFAQLPPAGARAGSRNWWDVLTVPRAATEDVVTASYRRLAKEYHPDRNPGDEEAKERYAEVDSAYARFKGERGL